MTTKRNIRHEGLRRSARPAPSAWVGQARRTAAAIGASVIALIVAPAITYAGTSGLELMQLQVFAKQSIQAASSDYEGPTAAGENLDLADFQINGDLTAGRRATFRRGKVGGFVNAPDTRLLQVFSSGVGLIHNEALALASLKLDRLGARLAALPATTHVGIEQGADGTTEFTARAQRDLAVVDLAGDQLLAKGDTPIRVVLGGAPGTQLLVRIRGERVRMRHVGFSVEGDLDPSRIVFFFPDASDLVIESSGGARSASGASWNWPGSIVAPDAVLHFGATTVMGQVFAQSISAIPGLPSGQVDRFTPDMGAASDAVDHIVPSQLLDRIDRQRPVYALANPLVDTLSRRSPAECSVICPSHSSAMP